MLDSTRRRCHLNEEQVFFVLPCSILINFAYITHIWTFISHSTHNWPVYFAILVKKKTPAHTLLSDCTRVRTVSPLSRGNACIADYTQRHHALPVSLSCEIFSTTACTLAMCASHSVTSLSNKYTAVFWREYCYTWIFTLHFRPPQQIADKVTNKKQSVHSSHNESNVVDIFGLLLLLLLCPNVGLEWESLIREGHIFGNFTFFVFKALSMTRHTFKMLSNHVTT